MSCKAVLRTARQSRVFKNQCGRHRSPFAVLSRAKPPYSTVPPSSRGYSSPVPSSFEKAAFSDHGPFGEGPSDSLAEDSAASASNAAATLSACPGCGALAQTIQPNAAGYYTLNRLAVKVYLQSVHGNPGRPQTTEDTVFEAALSKAGEGVLGDILARDNRDPEPSKIVTTPPCDRCHSLLHHHTGTLIYHPHIDSLHETISESPYKYNHVYHVIDAADFPLSLVPRIHELLSIQPLRSKNRRAQHSGFRHGKKTDMSFVITRSDLLAPKKEQVDRLMPYLIDVLREALGRAARDVRLGNVRCVSAKRDWWAKELKADVWHRGGGQWLVGKVNVGKSKLFESIFPKGKAEDINFDRERSRASRSAPRQIVEQEDHSGTKLTPVLEDGVDSDEMSLLPPARKETPYPTMPTVSHLPGTTASPIRIPFGSGKGELIDLPGLARSSLENYVDPAYHSALILKSRRVPEQHRVKKGQSLLLGGGLLRITPIMPLGVELLAYPFLPPEMKAHVTSTAKALSPLAPSFTDTSITDTTEQEADTPPASFTFPNIPTIAKPGVTTNLKHAATIPLAYDVTKSRAGPLTTKAAVGLKPERLPFKVLSVDVLIEGVGWIELTAQVRRRDHQRPEGQQEAEVNVQLFSPEGECVSWRRPMGAWALGRRLKT